MPAEGQFDFEIVNRFELRNSIRYCPSAHSNRLPTKSIQSEGWRKRQHMETLPTATRQYFNVFIMLCHSQQLWSSTDCPLLHLVHRSVGRRNDFETKSVPADSTELPSIKRLDTYQMSLSPVDFSLNFFTVVCRTGAVYFSIFILIRRSSDA